MMGRAVCHGRTNTKANAAHLAVLGKRVSVLRFLSEADAEERRLLLQRDGSGRTPLELCVDEKVRVDGQCSGVEGATDARMYGGV